MDTESYATPDNDEISLGELFDVFRRAKWLILCLAVVSTLVGYFVARALPKKYTASTIVSPVANSGTMPELGGLGALASQFGGLASLAGVSITGDSKKAETVAVLRSQELTERYIEDNRLLPILYASLWDPHRNVWKTSDPRKRPTLWKANQYFERQVRSISTDARSGLVTLTITWTDPTAAAQWANGLVKMTNDYLRSKAIDESDRNIAYLNEQAAKTDVVGAREVIFQLLQNEINKVMLARGSDEYALKVIDPAQAPERPSSPQTRLWAGGGFAIGTLVAMVLALWRATRAQEVAGSERARDRLELAGRH